jgi:hypothetical protein
MRAKQIAAAALTALAAAWALPSLALAQPMCPCPGVDDADEIGAALMRGFMMGSGLVLALVGGGLAILLAVRLLRRNGRLRHAT